jgi:hypothetical protein
MFKFAVCLLLRIGYADAATVTVSVNCGSDGSYQSGLTTARCFPGPSNFFGQTASASVAANTAYQDVSGRDLNGSLAVTTMVTPNHCIGLCMFHSEASGTFVDDYVFTVTGGTGQGLFLPCLAAGAEGPGSDGAASASFGSVTVANNAPASSCVKGIGPNIPLTPFSFGIPQTFAVSLAVQGTDGGFVVAELLGFQFFDTSEIR